MAIKTFYFKRWKSSDTTQTILNSHSCCPRCHQAINLSRHFFSTFSFAKKTLSTNMQVNFFPYPNLTNGAPALQMRLISKIEDRCDAFAYMQKKRKKTQLNLIMGWLYCTNLAHFLLIDGAVLYNYSVVLPKKGFFFFIESQHIWHMVIANWNGIMP